MFKSEICWPSFLLRLVSEVAVWFPDGGHGHTSLIPRVAILKKLPIFAVAQTRLPRKDGHHWENQWKLGYDPLRLRFTSSNWVLLLTGNQGGCWIKCPGGAGRNQRVQPDLQTILLLSTPRQGKDEKYGKVLESESWLIFSTQCVKCGLFLTPSVGVRPQHKEIERRLIKYWILLIFAASTHPSLVIIVGALGSNLRMDVWQLVLRAGCEKSSTECSKVLMVTPGVHCPCQRQIHSNGLKMFFCTCSFSRKLYKNIQCCWPKHMAVTMWFWH